MNYISTDKKYLDKRAIADHFLKSDQLLLHSVKRYVKSNYISSKSLKIFKNNNFDIFDIEKKLIDCMLEINIQKPKVIDDLFLYITDEYSCIEKINKKEFIVNVKTNRSINIELEVDIEDKLDPKLMDSKYLLYFFMEKIINYRKNILNAELNPDMESLVPSDISYELEEIFSKKFFQKLNVNRTIKLELKIDDYDSFCKILYNYNSWHKFTHFVNGELCDVYKSYISSDSLYSDLNIHNTILLF